MRIAVCDDITTYQTAVSEAIELWRKQRSIPSIHVQCFSSSEDLLDIIENRQEFDIIFLDIQIPYEMSGIELAKQIRKFNEYVQIVFVTNYTEYAFEGYHVNALRYLCKPVRTDQVAECLDIAYGQWKVMQSESVVLHDHRGDNVLMFKSILYVEANGHILTIHPTQMGEPITVRMTLDRLCDMLPHELFTKCHKSFLVNILYVRRITRGAVTLANGQEIAVGNQYRDSLRIAFNLYYQGKHL